MKITFLGQGFEIESENAVGYHLIKYLKQKDFHSFTGISAFASEAGIFGLSEYLETAKENFKSLTIIVGVDQKGTSKEALEEILKVIDKKKSKGYIFYQSERPIFHTKIYLFEGENHIKLILGSSNLTSMGLFSNVESSLLIEFDKKDNEGVNLLDNLKKYYKSLFDFSDPNLFEITTTKILEFVSNGIVPTEVERKQIFNSKIIKNVNQGDLNNISLHIPKRKTAKIPVIFKNKKTSKGIVVSQSIKETNVNVGLDLKLFNKDIDSSLILWESGPLKKRDLTIPKSVKTHQTGSMLFKKGKMQGIDQRHYFRDTVFSALPWAFEKKPKTSHLEKATAFFQIIIMGVDYGIFSLLLTHNTKTDTPSYKQNNSMTSLSWGAARSLIAKDELIDKSAILYKSERLSNKFILVIQ